MTPELESQRKLLVLCATALVLSDQRTPDKVVIDGDLWIKVMHALEIHEETYGPLTDAPNHPGGNNNG